MSYNLFIDDERDPVNVFWGSPDDVRMYHEGDWIIARSFDEVMQLIDVYGMPSVISFDHDLGKDAPTGYDIVKAIIDLECSEGARIFPDNFRYMMHTQNPIGKRNMIAYLENYFDVRDTKPALTFAERDHER